jgi:hypothetical protein
MLTEEIEAEAEAVTREEPVTRNLLCDYHPLLRAVMARLEMERGADRSTMFSPAFRLPALDAQMRKLFAVGTASWGSLGSYRDRDLVLLDLMQNPGAETTKTTASLLMVARAIGHIRSTGEKIVIIAPTSSNKGVALRDAVERALSAGLVTPEQLRVLVLAPHSAKRKLRNGKLATDAELRQLNPLLVYDGTNASDVKEIARSFVTTYADELLTKHGTRLWFSLDLRNYQAADATRAFIEDDVDSLGSGSSQPRMHAHAVSSAYGLLGYQLGLEVLEQQGRARPARQPGYFLMQHLATPDMVLSLYHDSFSRENVPRYERNALTGLYEQREDQHFPYFTFSPGEAIDSTFYTREPVTSNRMNTLIRRNGGGGIVVSLAECLARYAQVRMLLERCGVPVPADPRMLLEWSLIIALVGVLNAIDRNLISTGTKVVVHGTGLYTTASAAAIDDRATRIVRSAAEVAQALENAPL